MYSLEWFTTFAATVPGALTSADVAGITALLPRSEYPRVLDVGCGIGRVSGPLVERGYTVTGLDVSLAALRIARERAPGASYVALDQRHVGRLRWHFDGALVLWNSLGFVDRGTDVETLSGLAAILRRGGRVVFDCYHPAWLQRNERRGEPDDRGASVRRWLRAGRCLHEIRYPNGQVDEIQFNVYEPEELAELARGAGLRPVRMMTAWRPSAPPSADAPRYQLLCTRV